MTFLCNCKISCFHNKDKKDFILNNVIFIEGFKYAKWHPQYGGQRLLHILCSDSYLGVSEETWLINFDTKEVTHIKDSIDKPATKEIYMFIDLVIY